MNFGNLQKIRNGKRTYGITPHIPGGFITTDTMQKIVDVAKRYNGVLKLTSGQRILITNLKEASEPGEKLGFFIGRIGVNMFNEEVTKYIL